MKLILEIILNFLGVKKREGRKKRTIHLFSKAFASIYVRDVTAYDPPSVSLSAI